MAIAARTLKQKYTDMVLEEVNIGKLNMQEGFAICAALLHVEDILSGKLGEPARNEAVRACGTICAELLNPKACEKMHA